MSKIEWTDETINPIRARHKATGKVGWHCEHVSPACVNCYAEKQNFSGFAGGTRLPYKPGHRDDIEIFLDENALTKPLHWKRPRKIFVCSMTDLFADFVPDEWIDRVFAVMALAPQHTFQILTKRAGRMREYLSGRQWDVPMLGRLPLERIHLAAVGEDDAALEAMQKYGNLYSLYCSVPWPLPNAWLGVTAEDQARADERREDLRVLARAGWTTFVSYEPALGPVDWRLWTFLNWLIAGGESGPNARASNPAWFRAARDFCDRYGIPFFFKQWGEWRELIDSEDGDLSAKDWVFPTLDAARRVGKRRAGSLLDGREYREFPI